MKTKILIVSLMITTFSTIFFVTTASTSDVDFSWQNLQSDSDNIIFESTNGVSVKDDHFKEWINDNINATFSNNSKAIISVTDKYDVDLSVLNVSQKIELSVPRELGSSNVMEYNIIVIDSKSPEITLNSDIPNEVEASSHGPQWHNYISIYDQGDGIIVPTEDHFNDNSFDYGHIGANYLLSFTVSDRAGNTAIVEHHFEIISSDGGATIFVKEDANWDVEVNSGKPDFQENFYGNGVITIYDNNDYTKLGLGEIRARSTKGETYTEISVTIEIVKMAKPVIKGAQDLIIYNYGSSLPNWYDYIWVEDNYYTIDKESINVDLINVNWYKLGTYKINLSVVDPSGNKGENSISIKIVDTIAPEISISDDFIDKIEYNTPSPNFIHYATAWDNYDGNITQNIVLDIGNFTNLILGTYEISYYVEDSSKNATTIIKTIEVIYTGKPSVVPNESWEINKFVEVNEYQNGDINWTDYFVGEDDYYDVELSYDDTTINYNVLGNYLLEIFAKTVNGVYKTIWDVEIVDTIKPIISVPSIIISIEVFSQKHDFKDYISIYDNYDKNIVVSDDMVNDSKINYNVIGVYSVTVSFEDSSGNLAIEVFNVQIVDRVAPIVMVLESMPSKIELNSDKPDFKAHVNIMDNYDGLILATDDMFDDSEIDYSLPDTYTLYIRVSDSSSNEIVINWSFIVLNDSNNIEDGVNDKNQDITKNDWTIPFWLKIFTICISIIILVTIFGYYFGYIKFKK